MLTAACLTKCRPIALALAIAGPAIASAASGNLENPAPGQRMSGIGLLSGWHCEAKRVEISIDGSPPFAVPGGSSRMDLAGLCAGRTETGFGLLLGWNNLPPGEHTMRALADGVEFARNKFVVVDLGGQRIAGKGQRATVNDFPVPGQSTLLEWQESLQGFGITAVRPTSPVLAGRWNGADLERRSDCRATQNNGDHGTYAQYQVSYENGQFSLQENGVTGLACTYTGTYAQDGADFRAEGRYSCSDGKAGTFRSTAIMVTEREMSMQLAVQLEGSEVCTIDKTLGGSRY